MTAYLVCDIIITESEGKAMRSLYKRYDKNTTAWDLNASCRRFIINNKTSRHLRKALRKTLRKKLNKIFT